MGRVPQSLRLCKTPPCWRSAGANTAWRQGDEHGQDLPKPARHWYRGGLSWNAIAIGERSADSVPRPPHQKGSEFQSLRALDVEYPLLLRWLGNGARLSGDSGAEGAARLDSMI